MDELMIRKDNHIIQKTLNKFTYKQNQLMALLLGKYVNLKDDECLDTSISINEIRQLLNMSDGAENYELIKRTIRKFGENGSVGCLEMNKKGEYEYVWRPFFREIRLGENECIFAWNDLMKPYLIKLKENYTQYIASDYLKLKSVHSQNLYEQLKSVENFEKLYKKKPSISVDELRNIFQVNGKKTYATFKFLNSKILKKAVVEINEVTDLQVKYRTLKNGRTVKAVEFDIRTKPNSSKKKSVEDVPDWWNDTKKTPPSQELLDEIEQMQIELGMKKES